MATNLRLRPAAEDALRAESDRSGRSQQELMRDAIDSYLGLSGPAGDTVDPLVSSGVVRPPRSLLRHVDRLLSLPPGVTSLELLDRDDRI
jgi:hypothetical protein